MKIGQGPPGNRQGEASVLMVLCMGIIGTVIMASLVVRGLGRQGMNRMKLSVEDPRPLAKAIEILEARYGWVITYEDPRYVHDSEIADVTLSVRRDLDKFPPGEAPKVLVPKGGALAIEYEVSSQTNQPADPAVVVQQLINAHARSGNAGRFRLGRSGQIIHVIPTEFKNRAGKLAPQKSVLDTMISFPEKERTSMERLEAICAAITRETQTRVGLGIITVRMFQEDKQGATNQKARDVLVNTLESVKLKNGMNLSWQLFYDPGDKTYALNIHVVPKHDR